MSTHMLIEAREAPDAVARQLAGNAAAAAAIASALRARTPSLVATCARGSSDCAATYAKYLIETKLGVPVASIAPSVSSVYGARLKLDRALFVAISQSGRSPDLLSAAAMAKEQGAFIVAIVNDESAPLATLADAVMPMLAGPERSVAATKSFIASLSAVAHLVAEWSEDSALRTALASTPSLLRAAADLDWSSGVATLKDARSVLVIGRGFGFATAQEAALKLKETCGLHAEAYSAAEVRHGPMAILREGSVVMAHRPADAARESVDSVLRDFAQRGVRLLVAGGDLPLVEASPEIAPLAFIQSFYPFANALALARGENPDAPLSLSKVTETL